MKKSNTLLIKYKTGPKLREIFPKHKSNRGFLLCMYFFESINFSDNTTQS